MVQSLSRQGQCECQAAVNTFFCYLDTHYGLPVCFPRLCKLLGEGKSVSLELLYGQIAWNNAGVLDGVGTFVSDSPQCSD
jgi:hypothetical protein